MQRSHLKTYAANGREAYRAGLFSMGRSYLSALARGLTLCIFVVAVALFAGCSPQTTVEEEILAQKPLIWPDPPAPARISYVRSISTPTDIGASKGFFKKVVELVLGSDVNDMIKPYGVAVDSTGRVIVADTAFKRVHIYDIKAKKYSYIDRAGKADVMAPISVALDAEDNIYVTDSLAGKVLVYNRKGKFLSSFGAGARPTGIAADKDKKLLYVADTGKHVINVYNLSGRKVKSIGGWGNEPGMFNHPVDVFLDGNGDIYVVDTMNYKVQIFDNSGKFLARFGHQGDGSGDFGRPKGLAVDRDGHIYVADALFDTIQIFDRDGKFLLNFGKVGRNRGSFWMPGGMYIDRGNKIYVADTFNRRVQIFEYLGDPGVN